MTTPRLYPQIEPHRNFRLAVTGGHELYVELCGNPNGKPVVVLHGGPGAGCSPYMRRFFDPKRYLIVLFDQRGAGKSTPHGGLEANTTWDLVEDLERIRAHQVQSACDPAALAPAHEEGDPIAQLLAQVIEKRAGQIGGTPLAMARIDVEGEEGVPVFGCDLSAPEHVKLDTGLHRFTPFLADRFAFAR